MPDLSGSNGATPVSIFDEASGNQLAIDSAGRITSNRNWTLSSGTDSLAASQSGTWNITNVSGTVSLPTGASTSANQSTEITSLQLIDNLPNTLGSTTAGSSGALALGAVTTAAPTYTTGQNNALSLDTAGNLREQMASWLGSTAPTVGQKTTANSIPVTLASNQPAINVSATLDTAVSSGTVYVTIVQNYNLGTANVERMVCLIRNPNASGKTMYLKQVFLNSRTKTQSIIARVYADSTITTNGTANTITNTNIGSANTPVVLATFTPTISSNGTIVHFYGTGQNQNDEQVTTFADALQPNHNYLVTMEGSANNTLADLTLLWTEA